MNECEKNNSRQVQQGISVLVTILLVLAVILCLYVVICVLSNGYVDLGGFMMFRVVTGSMEPTIPVGALMVAKRVDIDSIRLSDIVCFRTQEPQIWGKIITHRVVEIFDTTGAARLLRTKGDANTVADQYFVDGSNLVGKVIWHTGDDNVMAKAFSLLTSKIGFLGCIVIPILILSGMILRDSVNSIRSELNAVLELQQQPQDEPDWQNDPLYGMTQEEYKEMYERIRAELMEELMHCAEVHQT